MVLCVVSGLSVCRVSFGLRCVFVVSFKCVLVRFEVLHVVLSVLC